MADTKISALPSGAPAQAGDEYVIARSGANYKLTGTNLLGLVTSTANTFTATQTFGIADVTTLEASNLRALDGTPAATIANSTGVIAVSTKVEYADGTAAAPTVTNTGDTDTGVYFPAANEVAVSAGGTVAAAFNSNGLFFRNRIINGDMRIDQRNAGAAVTVNSANNFYVVDRFFGAGQVTDGVFTVQQSTTAPTNFTNSIIATVTTADASLGATQQYLVGQAVEGFNAADLRWGTANALTVTLSFWVRSSLTGTFGGSLVNSGFNRSYPFTYSISSANTWEQKTVTIAGDTSGTWLTDNGVGIRVLFSLGAGSTYAGTAGAWDGSYKAGATGQTQVIGTLNATWYVTGVQLETGSVATPFERRPYGTELMLCQRYYYRLFPNAGQKLLSTGGQCFSTTLAGTYRSFPVPMRVAPSALEQSGTAAHYAVWDVAGNQIFGSSVPAFGSATTDIMASVNLSVASGLVAGSSTAMTTGNSAAYLGWSAEL
jgi:hypothetical protein